MVNRRDRKSMPWQALAPLLLIVFIASCGFGPGGGAPTSPALPSFPVITPIMPQEGWSVAAQPSATVSATPEPTAETSELTAYTVQPGETLLGIAKQHGIPMAAIQLRNDMGESTQVQAGQTLSIPPKEAWEGTSPFWVLHEVKPGETLIGIARNYDVAAQSIQRVNGLDQADRIVVGQTLILPLTGPAATRTPVPTETPLPTPTPTPSPTVTATVSVSVTITVTMTVSPPANAPATAAPGSAAPPAALAAWPREIARLINEVRAQQGMAPLGYNVTLEQAAQAHANDCAQRGWCSHTGSDGTNSKARIERAGYDASGWAECWAQTQSPQRAVEVWMNETPPNDPHRRTLLSDWLTEIGIGVAEADWGTYIIADFGRP